MVSIITGVSGQDGILLSQYLVARGEKVIGITRSSLKKENKKFTTDLESTLFSLKQCDLTDFTSVVNLIEEYKPKKIFHFSAQSSVSRSFIEPRETYRSITESTINLLEAMRQLSPHARFFNSASSEIFGETTTPANSRTLHAPLSPYATAKSAASLSVVNYRDVFSLHASNGYLFNHESKFRKRNFVTHKLINHAKAIKNGCVDKIQLGDISIRRDWGWAAEYVEAIDKIVSMERPDDLIVATGFSMSLQVFAENVFSHFDLDFNEFFQANDNFIRPFDIHCSRADISETLEKLDWEPQTIGLDVVNRLCIELIDDQHE